MRRLLDYMDQRDAARAAAAEANRSANIEQWTRDSQTGRLTGAMPRPTTATTIITTTATAAAAAAAATAATATTTTTTTTTSSLSPPSLFNTTSLNITSLPTSLNITSLQPSSPSSSTVITTATSLLPSNPTTTLLQQHQHHHQRQSNQRMCADYFGGICFREVNCKFAHRYVRCQQHSRGADDNQCVNPPKCFLLHITEGDIRILNNVGRLNCIISDECLVELQRVFTLMTNRSSERSTEAGGVPPRHCFAAAMLRAECPYRCVVCLRRIEARAARASVVEEELQVPDTPELLNRLRCVGCSMPIKALEAVAKAIRCKQNHIYCGSCLAQLPVLRSSPVDRYFCYVCQEHSAVGKPVIPLYI